MSGNLSADQFDVKIDALRAELQIQEEEGDEDSIADLKVQIEALHRERRNVADNRAAGAVAVPETESGFQADPSRELEGQDVFRRFRDAVREDQFRRARNLIAKSDLPLERREEMTKQVDQALNTWTFVKFDEAEEFLAQRDWQAARQLIDLMAERLGDEFEAEAKNWRSSIDVKEVQANIIRIRAGLDLDRPPESRPDQMPLFIQGLINELKVAGEKEHLALLRSEISVLQQAFTAEDARRRVKRASRRTLIEDQEWQKLLREANERLEDGESEFFFPEGPDDESVPIAKAIEICRRRLVENSESGIRKRVDEARQNYQIPRPDLDKARELVDEARSRFSQNASASILRELEACENELRELERNRNGCELQLKSVARIPNLKDVRVVIEEVGRKDPGHPLLSAAIRGVVTRFSAIIKRRMGNAKELAPQQASDILDGLETDIAELRQLVTSAFYEPVDDGHGNSFDAELEINNLTERIGQVRAEFEDAKRRAKQMEQARARLEAWIDAGRWDASEGSRLVEQLQEDPAEASKRLIARAAPLLDAQWKEQNAANRIALGDLSGAELLIRELRNEGAGQRIVGPLERKVQRLKIFLETKEALRERTLASLERAEATSLHLGLGDENSPVTAADLEALQSEVRRFRNGVVTTRQAIAEARAHLAATRFANARAALGGLKPELSDLGDEVSRLGNEIDSKWQEAIVSGLDDACRASNVNRICGLLDDFSMAFDRVTVGHDLAQTCFAVLAREWDEERGTVEVLAQAVKSSRAVALSQEDRDRREHGNRVLALRRDIPAVRRALDSRDVPGAKTLLDAPETQAVGRSVLAPLWVEVGLLEQDLDLARNWVGDVVDQTLKLTLESKIQVTSRMLTYTKDLKGSNLSRITYACADARIQLADASIRNHLGSLREGWERALRAFEDKCLRDIDEARQDAPLKDRLAPYERLRAAGMLPASKEIELSGLRRELVEPADALLMRVNTLLASVSPDQLSINYRIGEVKQLRERLADQPSDTDYSRVRHQLGRANDDLVELLERLQSLEQSKEVFEDLSQGKLDGLVIRRLEDIVRNIPIRFMGNPGHKFVQVMKDELATIQRTWDADVRLVDAIKRSWERGEYRECERRAGEAANDVLRQNDRFGLKASVEVPQDLSVVRGAANIRTMCSKKLALLNEWKRLVGELEGDRLQAAELAKLEQGLTIERYRSYRVLRERFETHQRKCQELLSRCAAIPSDPEGLLTTEEIEPFARSIQRVRLSAQDHSKSIDDFIKELARDAEEVEHLRPEVERLRRKMEENQEGPFWNRRPSREAQDNYERTMARLRKLRPDG